MVPRSAAPSVRPRLGATEWRRMVVIALLVPLAWLLGTFPSALIVAKAHGRDVMHEGSGNPGASNVARLMGYRAGLVVLLCDFAKGAIATGVGLAVGGRPGAFALGIAAMLGHIFPLYRKGGKGIAVGAGVLVVLYPLIVAPLAIVWVVIARVFHKSSVASLVVTIAFPLVVLATRDYALWEFAILSVLAVLVIARHSANIRRLIRHEEIDLGRQG
jgi:glycerol-3-phosphate acyltransferase PlsY